MAWPVVTGQRLIIAGSAAQCNVWCVAIVGGLRLEEDYVNRAVGIAAVILVSATRADSKVDDAVTVDVAERRNATPEPAIVRERRPSIRVVSDLPTALHAPVRVEHQHVDGAPIPSARIISTCRHGDVRYSVAIQVS